MNRNLTIKKITALDSFESMETDQLRYFSSLSPEELLQNHKRLSLAAYGLNKDPGSDKLDRKIKFGKAE